MESKGIIIIKKDARYRLAQFSHFDSYPSFLGYEIVKFFNNLKDWNKFKRNLRYIKMIPEDKTDEYKYINYSRFEILKDILLTNEEIITINNIEIFDDSSCKWAYVIDFDIDRFKIYKNSYNESGFPFSIFTNKVLFRSYDLNNLPKAEILKGPNYENDDYDDNSYDSDNRYDNDDDKYVKRV